MKELSIKEQRSVSGGDIQSGAQTGALFGIFLIAVRQTFVCNHIITPFDMMIYVNFISITTMLGVGVSLVGDLIFK